MDPDLPPRLAYADVRSRGVGRRLGTARRDQSPADAGLRADVHGLLEDHDAGLARRPARAVVKRGAEIAALGAEALRLRLHRLCLYAAGYLRPPARPCPATCLASAWSAMDPPLRNPAGGETGYTSVSAPVPNGVLMQAIFKAMIVN